MNVDPQDFRRHYEELADEALLDINRDDLVDVARDYYDAELGRRSLSRKLPARPVVPIPAANLTTAPADPNPCAFEIPEWGEKAVPLDRLIDLDRLADVRDVLDQAKIPCFLKERAGYRGVQLLVPASRLQQASRRLQQEIYEPDSESDFEHHFEELTDEELLNLTREALPEGSRADWDQEVASRGLAPAQTVPKDPFPQNSSDEDMVAVATFESAEDAQQALDILRAAKLRCELEQDPPEDSDSAGDKTESRLMVPASLFYRACEVLEAGLAGDSIDPE